MAEKWNDNQIVAITKTEGNMIVSASAGSGKTSVMIERVKRLIIEKKVPVSRIVMMSFNKAIAEEIKEKLTKALLDAVSNSDDKDFLREQIDDIGTADITTMHGFCNSLLKSYFDIVGVDPSYGIIEENESEVLINKTLNDLFNDYYEKHDDSFILLKDKLSASGDDGLRDAVKKIVKFKNALLRGDDWLDSIVTYNYGVKLSVNKALRVLYDKAYLYYNEADALVAGVISDYYNSLSDKMRQSVDYMAENLRNCRECRELIDFYNALPKSSLRLANAAGDDVVKESYAEAKEAYNTFVNYIKELFPISYEQMEREHIEDRKVIVKLVEIVKMFDAAYIKEKSELNKLDFNDLEHFAVKILSHEEIRDEIREKYDYICVDEYQDTNEVQEKIVESISRGDNLFMVGDPKQSIYKFRFTDPGIFVNKLIDYRESDKDHAVDLSENYRSSPYILGKVNQVFDRLMRNLIAGKIVYVYSRLVNGLNYDEEEGLNPFEVKLYSTSNRVKSYVEGHNVYKISDDKGEKYEKAGTRIEADYVADKIRHLLNCKIYDSKAKEYRQVQFSDMVILANSRSDNVINILDILEKEYLLPIDSSILRKKEEPLEVKIIMSFLRCIENARQDLPLYTTMRAIFGISDSTLMRIRRDNADKQFFHNAVFDGSCESDDIKSQLESFKAKLEHYRFMASFMSVYDFLNMVLEDSGYLDRTVMSQGGEESLDNIKKFIESVKEKSYCDSITSFLYAYDNFNLENTVGATPEGTGNVIQTSTIHQSKGLEYPIVFLIDTGSDFTPKDVSKGDYLMDKELGFVMKSFDVDKRTKYSNILFKAIGDKIISDEREERLRLLYVAMTRAKSCLYITGKIAKKYQGNPGDINKISSFAGWLNYIGEYDSDFGKNIVYECPEGEDGEDKVREENEVKPYFFRDYDEKDATEYKEVFEYQYPYKEATKLASKYTVTALNREDDEDKEYIPELYETEKTSIGTAYHKFMENVNYEARTYEDIDNEFNRMVREKLMTEEEIALIDKTDVYKCLNSTIINEARGARHEREKKFMMYVPLSDVKEGASSEKVIIQGIADLIIYGRDRNILVDFKKSSLPDNMLKEEYRRQLRLYKIALEESMNIRIDNTYLYVIGKDRLIEVD